MQPSSEIPPYAFLCFIWNDRYPRSVLESGFFALLRWWRGSRKRIVRIGDQRARILGPIGATETVLDVTNLKCSAGDLAIFDVDPLYARGFRLEYR